MSNASVSKVAPGTLVSEMEVSWSGIKAGRLKQTIQVKKDKYKIRGSAETIGLVALFVKASAGFAADGIIDKNGNQSESSSIEFEDDERGKTTLALGFRDGALIKHELEPVRRDPEETGRIPFKSEHLDNIVDPFAAMLFKVDKKHIGNGKKICDKKFAIFDGRRRMDLKFSFKNKTKTEINGDEIIVFNCKVKYEPVSGHRGDSRSTKFMAENQKIQVSMAQVGNQPIYTLFAFSSPVLRGTLNVKPKQFTLK